MVSEKEKFVKIIEENFDPPEIEVGKIETLEDLEKVEATVERKIGETVLNEGFGPDGSAIAIDSPGEESLTMLHDTHSGETMVVDEEGERVVAQAVDANRPHASSPVGDDETFHIPTPRGR